jgi:hypothetical protein
MTLTRVVSIGSKGRVLACEDPRDIAALPATTSAWVILPTDKFLLNVLTSIRMKGKWQLRIRPAYLHLCQTHSVHLPAFARHPDY